MSALLQTKLRFDGSQLQIQFSCEVFLLFIVICNGIINLFRSFVKVYGETANDVLEIYPPPCMDNRDPECSCQSECADWLTDYSWLGFEFQPQKAILSVTASIITSLMVDVTHNLGHLQHRTGPTQSENSSRPSRFLNTTLTKKDPQLSYNAPKLLIHHLKLTKDPNYEIKPQVASQLRINRYKRLNDLKISQKSVNMRY